jgi:membrane protease YdiL (CAAX protease family)
VSLAIAVQAFEAIAHANLAAYVASIVKWTTLGGGALVLGRRAGMSWDDLYLAPRGSFIVRRPASTCVVVILFIAVVNFGVLHRFTAAWETLGLPRAPVPYLAMPPSVLGRALGVVCAFAAATGSEILYRGYLRVVAERVFRTWWTAAVVVSAAFGWAHGFYGWYGAFYTGLNGLAFVLLARATGCLYVVILAHTCFDALVFAAG